MPLNLVPNRAEHVEPQDLMGNPSSAASRVPFEFLTLKGNPESTSFGTLLVKLGR